MLLMIQLMIQVTYDYKVTLISMAPGEIHSCLSFEGRMTLPSYLQSLPETLPSFLPSNGKGIIQTVYVQDHG